MNKQLTPDLIFGNWIVEVEWKPQDCWVGAFWKSTTAARGVGYKPWKMFDLWLCIIPMLPVHVSWHREGKR